MASDLTAPDPKKRRDWSLFPESFLEPFDISEWPQMWANRNVTRPRSYKKEFVMAKPRDVTLKDGSLVTVPAGTKVSKKLTVGVRVREDGKIRGLTTEHYNHICMLLFLWQKDDSAVIANSLSRYYDLLAEGSETAPRKYRRSSKHKKQFGEIIEDLMHVVTAFESKFTLPDGTVYEIESTFKFLSHRELFKREGSKVYFDFSRLTLDEEFVKTLKKSNFKVKRFDQLRKLRKPGARKLYTYLDFTLFTRTEFKRDVFDLAAELEIGSKRRDLTLNDLRKFASDLELIEFSHGMVGSIRLEKSRDEKSWNLAVTKVPLPEIIDVQETPPLPQPANVVKRQPTEAERRALQEEEDAELRAYHTALDEDAKLMIELYVEEAVMRARRFSEPSDEMKEGCFLNAVERYRKEEEEAKANAEKEDQMAAIFYEAGKRKLPLCSAPAAESPYETDPRAEGFRRLAACLVAFAVTFLPVETETH